MGQVLDGAYKGHDVRSTPEGEAYIAIPVFRRQSLGRDAVAEIKVITPSVRAPFLRSFFCHSKMALVKFRSGAWSILSLGPGLLQKLLAANGIREPEYISEEEAALRTRGIQIQDLSARRMESEREESVDDALYTVSMGLKFVAGLLGWAALLYLVVGHRGSAFLLSDLLVPLCIAGIGSAVCLTNGRWLSVWGGLGLFLLCAVGAMAAHDADLFHSRTLPVLLALFGLLGGPVVYRLPSSRQALSDRRTREHLDRHIHDSSKRRPRIWRR